MSAERRDRGAVEDRSADATEDGRASAVAALVVRVVATVLGGAVTVETGLAEGWLDGYPVLAAAFTALAGWAAFTAGREVAAARSREGAHS